MVADAPLRARTLGGTKHSLLPCDARQRARKRRGSTFYETYSFRGLLPRVFRYTVDSNTGRAQVTTWGDKIRSAWRAGPLAGLRVLA